MTTTFQAMAKAWFMVQHLRELGVKVEWVSGQKVRRARKMQSEVRAAGQRIAVGRGHVLMINMEVLLLPAASPALAVWLIGCCLSAGEAIA